MLLEVFNNLFMSIAEQMGEALRNTAQSVNIKERLDFSCAVFDTKGELVANAPHMPVHLGSMDRSVETVIRANAGKMQPGDVYMLNAPYNGGTHLPDITVITPVFASSPRAGFPSPWWGGVRGGGNHHVGRQRSSPPSPPLLHKGGGEKEPEILFYVASRGHHEDIGGLTPGSMTPRATTIEEEGVYIDNFKLVDEGRFLEAETHRAAVRRQVSRAHAGQEHRRPQGARRRQRQGRRRTGEDGRPLRPRRGQGLHAARAGQRRGKRAPPAVAAGGRRTSASRWTRAPGST